MKDIDSKMFHPLYIFTQSRYRLNFSKIKQIKSQCYYSFMYILLQMVANQVCIATQRYVMFCHTIAVLSKILSKISSFTIKKKIKIFVSNKLGKYSSRCIIGQLKNCYFNFCQFK